MSKEIHFRATDTDQKRLTDLIAKLGTTLTAVIREAIRLLHKKEIK
jgi:predicted DNA-binding protein